MRLTLTGDANENAVFFYDGTHLVNFGTGWTLQHKADDNIVSLTAPTTAPTTVKFGTTTDYKYTVQLATGEDHAATLCLDKTATEHQVEGTQDDVKHNTKAHLQLQRVKGRFTHDRRTRLRGLLRSHGYGSEGRQALCRKRIQR